MPIPEGTKPGGPFAPPKPPRKKKRRSPPPRPSPDTQDARREYRERNQDRSGQARDTQEAAEFTRSKEYARIRRRDARRAALRNLRYLMRTVPKPTGYAPRPGEHYTGRDLERPKKPESEREKIADYIAWYLRTEPGRQIDAWQEAYPEVDRATIARGVLRGPMTKEEIEALPDKPYWTTTRAEYPSPEPQEEGWAHQLADALFTIGSGDLPTPEAQQRARRMNPARDEMAATFQGIATAGELALGPDTIAMLRGKDFDPKMVGLEIGSIFTGPIRAVAAPVRGVKTLMAGRGGKAALEAAREAHRAPGVIPAAARRTYRVGNLDIHIPAARARTGRLAERAADRMRPTISRVTRGKYKSVEAKAGEELNRTVRLYQKRHAAHANALRQIEKGLKPREIAAAHMALGQFTPEEALKFRQDNIARFTESGNEEYAYYNRVHMKNEQEGAQYLSVGTDPERLVTLGPKASKRLRRYEEVYRASAALREAELEEVGRLPAEQAARRAIAEARIVRGARYQTWDQQVRAALEADPGREVHFKLIDIWVDRGWMSEKEAKAVKEVFDASYTAYARNHAKIKGSPQSRMGALSEIQGRFVGSEPISPEAAAEMVKGMGLAQLRYQGDDLLQRASSLPENLPSREIAERILAEGHALPPELSTPEGLAAAIDRVYAMADEGSNFKDWYSRAGIMARTIGEQEGVSADQAAQLLAIYSQASGTIANVKFVLDAIRQFKETGVVTSIGRFPKRQAQEATNVLKGEGWAGRKRSSFYMNIIEEADPNVARGLGISPDSVTVDRWVVRMFAPESGKIVPGKWYDGIERVVQEMAAPIAWKPKEIQAAAWVTAKGKSLAERYPLWPSARVKREAADAFERGFEEHGAQQRLFGPGLAPEEKPYKGKGIPGARIPASLNEAAADAKKPDGGFTLDAFLRPYRGDGYAVSLPGNEELVRADELTAEHIAEYAKRKLPQLKEDDQLYIGGWHNPEDGMVYLDLSKIVPDRTTAVNLARAGKQEAFYDFGTGTVIPASGKHVGEDAAKAYEELLDRTARQLFGAKGKKLGPRQREQAEEILDDWADENPEHELARLYNDLSYEASQARISRMPDPDSVEFQERYFQADSPFEDWSRKSLDKLAEDVAKLLPEEEWPMWVKAHLRREAEKAGDEATRTPDEFPEDWLAQASWFQEPSRRTQSYNYFRDQLRDTDPSILRALTERPTPQTVVAAANAAVNVADRRALKILTEELQRLMDEGADDAPVARGFFNTFIPKGMEEASPEEIARARAGFMQFVVGEADVTTFVHEHAHFLRSFGLTPAQENRIARWAGANPIGKVGDFGIPEGGWEWTREAEEKFARGVERWLMQGEGPDGLRPAVYTIAQAMRAHYDDLKARGSTPIGMVDEVPPQVARVFKSLYRPGKMPSGGRIVGEEALERPGAIRVPLARGVPLSADSRAVRSVISTNSRLFGAGRKAAVGAGQDDINLRKAYKGSLLMSGFYTTSLAEPMARDLVIAGRMAASYFVRKKLLEAGTELPTRVDDIAVKVDPKKNADPALAALFDKLESLERAGVDYADIKGFDIEMAEALKRASLPDTIMVDGMPVDVRMVAAKAIEEQQPIDNIVWVPREFIDQSGILYTPKPRRRGPGKKGQELSLLALDTLNDAQRVSILYLNPAYIPVNLAGNVVMNVMQQGVFLPRNMWRAATMHRNLGYLTKNQIDAYMGTGLTGSLMGKTQMMQGVNATLGHWIQLATDMIPRRAAFIHEAAKLGYKTPAQLKKLLDGPFEGDLETIVRKANDAIVDFDRMSPMEREVLTRAIFVYPWLKGATRYAARFAFEHPLQFAGLMFLGEHAYHTSEEMLGDRPFFAESVVPVSTKSIGAKIPGVGRFSLADAVGEHTWTDRGMPMAVDVRQVLTATTPASLVQAAVGFFTGSKEAPALVESLVPAVGAFITASTGYDAFLEREVPRGIGTFAKQLADIPAKQRYEQIFMSDEERADYQEVALRPRTREQEIWRAFGGGLAPAPYSLEVGEERRREGLSTFERNKLELEDDSREAGLGQPPPEVIKDMEWYYKLEAELESGMTSKEKLEVAARLYDEKNGGREMSAFVPQVKTQGEAEALYDEIRPLIYPWYTAWNREVDKILDTKAQLQPVGG